MKKMILMLIVLSLILNCQSQNFNRESSEVKQPYVVSVSPRSVSENDLNPVLTLQFSHPLNQASLTSDTVFILNASVFSDQGWPEWRDLVDDVEDDDIDVLPVSFELNVSEQTLVLTLQEPLVAGESYVLFVTPKVLSADLYPLNQMGHDSETEDLRFVYNLSSNENVPDLNSEITAGNQAGSAGTESGSSSEIEIVPIDTNRVLISEVVTDPMQDHNESTFGNGVLFDAEPGSGTVGSTDEYVEIYNGTDLAVSLLGWTLTMEDGTDEVQTLGEDVENSYFSSGGGFENFQPGEFVVLGNPAGSINNEVTLTLSDENQELVDSIYVEDANADDLATEAYVLDVEEGLWEQGFATPGF